MTPLPTLYLPPGSMEARQRQLETRAPKAATQPLVYTSPGRVTINEWNADQAFRLGYLANVIAYRCIQLTAQAIASVPLVAGPKRGGEQNPNAPIAKLLGPPPGGPALRLSARKLIRWTVAQQVVTGRRAWEIETPNADPDERPIAFWPLVSARLEAEATQRGDEWFKVFAYGRHGNLRKLRPDQVFYGWDPSGLDFRQAESALQSARFDLSLVTDADRYSVAFLRNNATPATVVTTDAFPNKEARERFRNQWSAEYGGPANAGRTLFHEAGDGEGPVGETIDVKVLGLSQKDSRLIEQRKDALMEVAIALGTPWSKLDASGRTFDNAEIEDRTWWNERLLPMLVDLEDDINMQLAPRLGNEVVWFDLTTVPVLQRRFKPMTQVVGTPSLVQAQLMTINEARADYDLPPVANGDRMMTAEEIVALRGQMPGEPATRALPPGDLRDEQSAPDRGAGDAEVREDSGGSTTVRPFPAPEHRAIDAEAMELRRARIWRRADATVRTIEAAWERAWRRIFDAQAKSTLARLNGKRGRQALGYGTDGLPLEQRAADDPAPQIDPEDVFSRAHWTEEARQAAIDLYEQCVAQGFARVSDLFGVAFDVSSPYAADFIANRAQQLAGLVTDTTYEAIRLAMQEGVTAGESIPKLAKRITDVFEDASTRRATVIARTEVISAYNGSATLAATQLPADVVGGQEWIATRDSRTRRAHGDVDGQIRPIGQPFDVGGDQLAYPGDPAGSARNTVQCRCTVAFLTPEEMVAQTQMARPCIEARVALALILSTRYADPDFDLLTFRRAAMEVAQLRPSDRRQPPLVVFEGSNVIALHRKRHAA